MRFKPGTTNEEARARLAAFAEKQRNGGRNPGPMPEPPRTPIKNVSPQRPVLPPRPSTQPVRPGVSPPQQPNVMGFPDMPNRSVGVPGTPTYREMYPSGGRPANPFTVDARPIGPNTAPPQVQPPVGGGRPANPFTVDRMPTGPNVRGFPDRPAGFGPGSYLAPLNAASLSNEQRAFLEANKSPNEYRKPITNTAPMQTPDLQAMQQAFGRPTSMPPTQGPPVQQAVAQNPMGSQQAAQQTAGAALQGFANKAGSFFKKGGAVTTKAKAPVKKAAGGKVAAKAPVKKAMGGPIKAKTAAKPAAKMAKPMPAMKRGGKVMAKGRKK